MCVLGFSVWLASIKPDVEVMGFKAHQSSCPVRGAQGEACEIVLLVTRLDSTLKAARCFAGQTVRVMASPSRGKAYINT